MKVDFNIPLKTLKGKNHTSMRPMTQDEDITDDMEVKIIDSEGGAQVRVEVVKSLMVDVVVNSLMAPKFNESVKKKKKFRRAQLAELIAVADGEIEISIAQANDIIAAVDLSGSPLELMRTCELVDPDGSLMGEDD